MTIIKLAILPMVILFVALICISISGMIVTGDLGYVTPIAISLVGLLVMNEIRRNEQ